MPSPPDWILQMANAVATRLYAVDVLAPLGCHFYFNDETDQWEVTLFVSDTQTVGGRLDGQRLPARFCVDLISVQELFSEVTRFHWQATRIDETDELGPHVSVEGMYQGYYVWVRVLAHAPDRFEVGRNIDVNSESIEDVW